MTIGINVLQQGVGLTIDLVPGLLVPKFIISLPPASAMCPETDLWQFP